MGGGYHQTQKNDPIATFPLPFAELVIQKLLKWVTVWGHTPVLFPPSSSGGTPQWCSPPLLRAGSWECSRASGRCGWHWSGRGWMTTLWGSVHRVRSRCRGEDATKHLKHAKQKNAKESQENAKNSLKKWLKIPLFEWFSLFLGNNINKCAGHSFAHASVIYFLEEKWEFKLCLHCIHCIIKIFLGRGGRNLQKKTLKCKIGRKKHIAFKFRMSVEFWKTCGFWIIICAIRVISKNYQKQMVLFSCGWTHTLAPEALGFWTWCAKLKPIPDFPPFLALSILQSKPRSYFSF